jgi:hypothetical protein
MAVDRAGNVIVAGWTTVPGRGKDVVVVKYSALGVLKWARVYKGPTRSGDLAAALALDHGGNVYAAGSTATATKGRDVLLVKFAGTTGKPSWRFTFDGGFGLDDAALTCAVTSSGETYLTGYSTDSGGATSSALVLKVSPKGAKQWRRLERFATTSQGQRIFVMSNGDVIVGGGSNNGELFVARLSSAGAPVWPATATQPWPGYGVSLTDLTVGSAGVFACGNQTATGCLFRWGLDGTFAWAYPWTTPTSTALWAITVDGAGDIFGVGGMTDSTETEMDAVIYAAGGGTLPAYTTEIAGSGPGQECRGNDVLYTGGTRAALYVCGVCTSGTTQRGVLAKVQP